jgi:putative transposase
MARRRPPRLAPALYVGLQRYFLTICCDGKERWLVNPSTRELVLSELRRTSDVEGIAVVAYCLMTDHLHAVVEGIRDDSDCLAFVRAFKQRTAFKQHTGRRLWQSSFHDRVLRDYESTQAVVRYVLENPVRSKLVDSPAAYPHSGSLSYSKKDLLEWAFGWNSDLM